ncbi:YHR126C-like protein [Saccharomyces cerevisiae VL3]|nr:YHR126C-like protein [Saccharomyces cerevisiae VL3]
MKCTLVSTLFAITNILVAHAQVSNSSDTLDVQFANSTNSYIEGKFNSTDEAFNSSASWSLAAQQKKISNAAVYDVGGWNGSLYRSNRSAVADHQRGKKQDAAISQISDGQIQATASGPETTAATTPSSTANVSVYEGAGMKVESKNMGYIVGVAALLFL